jgi:hypothetical protein
MSLVCRGSQRETIMSLVVCNGVTKRHYYVSSLVVQTTRDIIVSLCDPLQTRDIIVSLYDPPTNK